MVSSHAEYPIDVFEEDLILRHAMACLLNTVREALTISVGVTAAWLGGALLLYAHGAGAVTDIDTGTGAASASGTNAGFVSLYGVIDTSVEITDPGSGWVARMDSGAYRGSRVGLHGAEPLGGGNAIVFTLENGFGSTDGSLQVPGSIFNRQAWIGASGGWGELRFGRQYSPIYIPFKGDLDAFGAGTIASGLNNLSKITPYANNAVAYLSPRIAGFSATLMMAMRDPSEKDGNGIDGYYVTASYRFDQLHLLYARQQTHGAGALRANLGGANYAFGKLRVWLSFFNGDGGAPVYHGAGGSLSAQYSFSNNARASLGYAHVRDYTTPGGSADQFSAAFEYSMSPTLLLYFSAAYLANHDDSSFTLRGVNVTGLPVAYPGAPVAGVQFGVIERF
ncbi:putative porin [Paraburkholderia youngii]|uniref:Porin n=1 Tax=Paraburkholderia youngii TaxID=2782701 RepID=A0ABX2NTF8_9BURK|nr:porin [Paraburkholderia youngii]NUX58245.1 porin [Paraburkholderia youngii]NVI07764.1 porin [Paraburkholderia youngii]